ncbi:LacI family DNA-binding transcriptional regulator [Cellvibrio polysaccharolyticus]|uniref:LacI family DNA-binding transcriptional regulator n=1 Tax=Cellvibrio polysaccharolyticus TaxID=2082724 RepID=A0A928YW48_9GAMM|nr:LacI family DNA-binding transcriptional regulator [Cellvibrio polysaccharolyticus]MBE8717823.1 LacI family DNA-binding transcriptional regulator [Cellvibrio polysaccharolyticus]
MDNSLPATTRKPRSTAGRVTIRQVASHVGVSAITVSRYFKQPDSVSEELRGQIAAAVAELGYVPNLVAGGLASASSRIVGMVIPNISGPIFANTIQSFSDILSQNGYQLMLSSSYFSSEQEENAVRSFLGWSPAALVLTSYFHTEATEKMIAQAGIPVLEIWDLQTERSPIQVGFMHEDVGRMAARYLIGKGYQRIAFVTNSIAGDGSAVDRSNGYKEVVEQEGRAAQIFTPTARLPLEAGEEAFKALIGGDKPADAIIFANDNLACGALLAAQRAGIHIPQQCAIVGFGDYAIADKLYPSLTTIRPPATEIGEVAARRILELVGALPAPENAPAHFHLQCTLIERESS